MDDKSSTSLNSVSSQSSARNKPTATLINPVVMKTPRSKKNTWKRPVDASCQTSDILISPYSDGDGLENWKFLNIPVSDTSFSSIGSSSKSPAPATLFQMAEPEVSSNLPKEGIYSAQEAAKTTGETSVEEITTNSSTRNETYGRDLFDKTKKLEVLRGDPRTATTIMLSDEDDDKERAWNLHINFDDGKFEESDSRGCSTQLDEKHEVMKVSPQEPEILITKALSSENDGEERCKLYISLHCKHDLQPEICIYCRQLFKNLDTQELVPDEHETVIEISLPVIKKEEDKTILLHVENNLKPGYRVVCPELDEMHTVSKLLPGESEPDSRTVPDGKGEGKTAWTLRKPRYIGNDPRLNVCAYCRRLIGTELLSDEPLLTVIIDKEDERKTAWFLHSFYHLVGNRKPDYCIYCRELPDIQKPHKALEKESKWLAIEYMPAIEDERKAAWSLHSSHHLEGNQNPESCIYCRQLLESQKSSETSEGEPELSPIGETLPEKPDESKTSWFLHSSYHFQGNQKPDTCTYCKQLLEEYTPLEGRDDDLDLKAKKPLHGHEDERKIAWTLHEAFHLEGNQKPDSCIYCRKLVDKEVMSEVLEEGPELMIAATLADKEDERITAFCIHNSCHLEGNRAPDSCIYCRQLLEKQKPPDALEGQPDFVHAETLPEKEEERANIWYLHSSYHFGGNQKPDTCVYCRQLLQEQTMVEAIEGKPDLMITETLGDEEDERQSAWYLHSSYHFEGNEQPDSCVYCEREADVIDKESLPNEDERKLAWDLHNYYHLEGNQKSAYCIYCREQSKLQESLQAHEPDIKVTETSPLKEDEKKTAYDLHTSNHLEGTPVPENCIHCRVQEQKQSQTGELEPDLTFIKPFDGSKKELKTAWFFHSSYHFANQYPDTCMYCVQLLEKKKSPHIRAEEADLSPAETLHEREDERTPAWYLHRSYHVEGNRKPDNCVYCWEAQDKQKELDVCLMEPDLMTTNLRPDKELERTTAWQLHQSYHLQDKRRPQDCIYCRQLLEKPEPSEIEHTAIETLPEKDDEPETSFYLHGSYHFEGNEKPDTCLYCKLEEMPEKEYELRTILNIHLLYHLKGNEKPDSCIYCRQQLQTQETIPVQEEEEKTAWHLHCCYHFDGNKKPDTCLYCMLDEMLEEEKLSILGEEEAALTTKETLPHMECESKMAWSLHNAFHLEGSEKPDSCIYCKEVLGKEKIHELYEPDTILDKEDDRNLAWFVHNSNHSENNRKPETCIYCRKLLELQKISEAGEGEAVLTSVEQIPVNEDERKTAWYLHSSCHFEGNQKPDSCVYCKQLIENPPETREDKPELIDKDLLPDNNDERTMAWSLHCYYHDKNNRKPESCVYCKELPEKDKTLEEAGFIASERLPENEDELRTAENLHTLYHSKGNEKPDSCIYCRQQRQTLQTVPIQEEEEKTAWHLHCCYHFEGNKKPDTCLYCMLDEEKLSIPGEEKAALTTKETLPDMEGESKMAWSLHNAFHLEGNEKPDSCIYCKEVLGKEKIHELYEPDTILDKEDDRNLAWFVHNSNHSENNRKPETCIYCRNLLELQKISEAGEGEAVLTSVEQIPVNEDERKTAWYLHSSCHFEGNQKPDSCVYCKQLIENPPENREDKPELIDKDLLPDNNDERTMAWSLHCYYHDKNNRKPESCVYCKELPEKDKTLEEAGFIASEHLPENEDELRTAENLHTLYHSKGNEKSDSCIYCRQQRQTLQTVPIQEEEEKTAWHLHCCYHFEGNKKPDTCLYCMLDEMLEGEKLSITGEEKAALTTKETLPDMEGESKMAWSLHNAFHLEGNEKPDSCIYCKEVLGKEKIQELYEPDTILDKEDDRNLAWFVHNSNHSENNRKPETCIYCRNLLELQKISEAGEGEAVLTSVEQISVNEDERKTAWYLHSSCHFEGNQKPDSCVYCKQLIENPPETREDKPELIDKDLLPDNNDERTMAWSLHCYYHDKNNRKPESCVYCKELPEKDKTLEEAGFIASEHLPENEDELRTAENLHTLYHSKGNEKPDSCIYCRQQRQTLQTVPIQEEEEKTAWHLHCCYHFEGNKKPDTCLYCMLDEMLEGEKLSIPGEEKAALTTKETLPDMEGESKMAWSLHNAFHLEGNEKPDSCIYCKEVLGKEKIQELYEPDTILDKEDDRNLAWFVHNSNHSENNRKPETCIYCRNLLELQKISEAGEGEAVLTSVEQIFVNEDERKTAWYLHSSCHFEGNQKPDSCVYCKQLIENPPETREDKPELIAKDLLPDNNDERTMAWSLHCYYHDKNNRKHESCVYCKELPEKDKTLEEAGFIASEHLPENEDELRTAENLHTLYHSKGNEKPDSCIYCRQQRQTLQTVPIQEEEEKTAWHLHCCYHFEGNKKPDTCLYCMLDEMLEGEKLSITGEEKAALTTKETLPDMEGESKMAWSLHNAFHLEGNEKPDSCIYCKEVLGKEKIQELYEPDTILDKEDDRNLAWFVHNSNHSENNRKPETCIYCRNLLELQKISEAGEGEAVLTSVEQIPVNEDERKTAWYLHSSCHFEGNQKPDSCVYCKQLIENPPETREDKPELIDKDLLPDNNDERTMAWSLHCYYHDKNNRKPESCVYCKELPEKDKTLEEAGFIASERLPENEDELRTAENLHTLYHSKGNEKPDSCIYCRQQRQTLQTVPIQEEEEKTAWHLHCCYHFEGNKKPDTCLYCMLDEMLEGEKLSIPGEEKAALTTKETLPDMEGESKMAWSLHNAFHLEGNEKPDSCIYCKEVLGKEKVQELCEPDTILDKEDDRNLAWFVHNSNHSENNRKPETCIYCRNLLELQKISEAGEGEAVLTSVEQIPVNEDERKTAWYLHSSCHFEGNQKPDSCVYCKQLIENPPETREDKPELIDKDLLPDNNDERTMAWSLHCYYHDKNNRKPESCVYCKELPEKDKTFEEAGFIASEHLPENEDELRTAENLHTLYHSKGNEKSDSCIYCRQQRQTLQTVPIQEEEEKTAWHLHCCYHFEGNKKPDTCLYCMLDEMLEGEKLSITGEEKAALTTKETLPDMEGESKMAWSLHNAFHLEGNEKPDSCIYCKEVLGKEKIQELYEPDTILDKEDDSNLAWFVHNSNHSENNRKPVTCIYCRNLLELQKISEAGEGEAVLTSVEQVPVNQDERKTAWYLHSSCHFEGNQKPDSCVYCKQLIENPPETREDKPELIDKDLLPDNNDERTMAWSLHCYYHDKNNRKPESCVYCKELPEKDKTFEEAGFIASEHLPENEDELRTAENLHTLYHSKGNEKSDSCIYCRQQRQTLQTVPIQEEEEKTAWHLHCCYHFEGNKKPDTCLYCMLDEMLEGEKLSITGEEKAALTTKETLPDMEGESKMAWSLHNAFHLEGNEKPDSCIYCKEVLGKEKIQELYEPDTILDKEDDSNLAWFVHNSNHSENNRKPETCIYCRNLLELQKISEAGEGEAVLTSVEQIPVNEDERKTAWYLHSSCHFEGNQKPDSCVYCKQLIENPPETREDKPELIDKDLLPDNNDERTMAWSLHCYYHDKNNRKPESCVYCKELPEKDKTLEEAGFIASEHLPENEDELRTAENLHTLYHSKGNEKPDSCIYCRQQRQTLQTVPIQEEEEKTAWHLHCCYHFEGNKKPDTCLYCMLDEMLEGEKLSIPGEEKAALTTKETLPDMEGESKMAWSLHNAFHLEGNEKPDSCIYCKEVLGKEKIQELYEPDTILDKEDDRNLAWFVHNSNHSENNRKPETCIYCRNLLELQKISEAGEGEAVLTSVEQIPVNEDERKTAWYLHSSCHFEGNQKPDSCVYCKQLIENPPETREDKPELIDKDLLPDNNDERTMAWSLHCYYHDKNNRKPESCVYCKELPEKDKTLEEAGFIASEHLPENEDELRTAENLHTLYHSKGNEKPDSCIYCRQQRQTLQTVPIQEEEEKTAWHLHCCYHFEGNKKPDTCLYCMLDEMLEGEKLSITGEEKAALTTKETLPDMEGESKMAWSLHNAFHLEGNEKPDSCIYCKEVLGKEKIQELYEPDTILDKEDDRNLAWFVHNSNHSENNRKPETCIYCRNLLELQKISEAGEGEAVLTSVEQIPVNEDERKTAWYLHSSCHFEGNQKPDSCVYCKQLIENPPETREDKPELIDKDLLPDNNDERTMAWSLHCYYHDKNNRKPESCVYCKELSEKDKTLEEAGFIASERLPENEDELRTAENLHTLYHSKGNEKPDSCIYCRQQRQTLQTVPIQEEEEKTAWHLHCCYHFEGNKKPDTCLYCMLNEMLEGEKLSIPGEEKAALTTKETLPDMEGESKMAWSLHNAFHLEGNEKPDSCIYCKEVLGKEKIQELYEPDTFLDKEDDRNLAWFVHNSNHSENNRKPETCIYCRKLLELQKISEAGEGEAVLTSVEQIPVNEDERKTAWYLHSSCHFEGNQKPDSCVYCKQLIENPPETREDKPELIDKDLLPDNNDERTMAWSLHCYYHDKNNRKPESCVYCKELPEKDKTLEEAGFIASEHLPENEDELRTAENLHTLYHSKGNEKPDSCIYCRQQRQTLQTVPIQEEEEKTAWHLHCCYHFEGNKKPDTCLYCMLDEMLEGEKLSITGEEKPALTTKETLPDMEGESKMAWSLHNAFHLEGNEKSDSCIYCKEVLEKEKIQELYEPDTILDKEDDRNLAWFVHNSNHSENNRKPETCIYCRNLLELQKISEAGEGEAVLTSVEQIPVNEDERKTAWYLHSSCHFEGNQKPDSCVYCKQLIENPPETREDKPELIDKDLLPDNNDERTMAWSLHCYYHDRNNRKPESCVYCKELPEKDKTLEEAGFIASERLPENEDELRTAENLHTLYHSKGNEKPDSCIYCRQQRQTLQTVPIQEEEEKTAWHLHCCYHFEGNKKPDTCLYCMLDEMLEGEKLSIPGEEKAALTTKETLPDMEGESKMAWSLHNAFHLEGNEKPDSCIYCKEVLGKEKIQELYEPDTILDKEDDRNLAWFVHNSNHSENNRKPETCIYCRKLLELQKISEADEGEAVLTSVEQIPVKEDERKTAWYLHSSCHFEGNQKPDSCVYCKQLIENLPETREDKRELIDKDLLPDNNDERTMAWSLHCYYHDKNNRKPEGCVYCKELPEKDKTFEEAGFIASEHLPENEDELRTAENLHTLYHSKGNEKPDSCIYCRQQRHTLQTVPIQEEVEKTAWHLHCCYHFEGNKKPDTCLYCVLDEMLEEENLSMPHEEKAALTSKKTLPNMEGEPKMAWSLHNAFHLEDNEKPDNCIYCREVLGKEKTPKRFEPDTLFDKEDDRNLAWFVHNSNHLENRKAETCIYCRKLLELQKISEAGEREAVLTSVEQIPVNEDERKTAWYLHSSCHFEGNQKPDSCVYCRELNEELAETREDKPDLIDTNLLSDNNDERTMAWSLHCYYHGKGNRKPDNCVYCRELPTKEKLLEEALFIVTERLPENEDELRTAEILHNLYHSGGNEKPDSCIYCRQQLLTHDRSECNIEEDEEKTAWYLHSCYHFEGNEKPETCIYCMQLLEKQNLSATKEDDLGPTFTETVADQVDERISSWSLHRYFHCEGNKKPDSCIYCREIIGWRNTPDFENKELELMTREFLPNKKDKIKEAWNLHNSYHLEGNEKPDSCIFCRQLLEQKETLERDSNIMTAEFMPLNENENKTEWYIHSSCHFEGNQKPDSCIYCRPLFEKPTEVRELKPDVITMETLPSIADERISAWHLHKSFHEEDNPKPDCCIYCRELLVRQKTSGAFEVEPLLDVRTECLSEEEQDRKTAWDLHNSCHLEGNEKPYSCIYCRQQFQKQKELEAGKEEPEALARDVLSDNECEGKTHWYLHCSYHFEGNEKPETCKYCVQQRETLVLPEGKGEEPGWTAIEPLLDKEDEREMAWRLHTAYHCEANVKPEWCVFCRELENPKTSEVCEVEPLLNICAECLAEEEEEKKTAWNLHSRYHLEGNEKFTSCIYCRQQLQTQDRSEVFKEKSEQMAVETVPGQEDEWRTVWQLHSSYHFEGNEKPDTCLYCMLEEQNLADTSEEKDELKEALTDKEGERKIAWSLHNAFHSEGYEKPDSCVYCRELRKKQKPSEIYVEGPGPMITETLSDRVDEFKKALDLHTSFHLEGNWKPESCIYCRQLLTVQKVTEDQEEGPDMGATETMPSEEDERKTPWHLHSSFHFKGNEKPDTCKYCKQIIEEQKVAEACQGELNLIATDSLIDKEDERASAWQLHISYHVERNQKSSYCIYCKELPEDHKVYKEESELQATEFLPDKEDENKTAWDLHCSSHLQGIPEPECCIYCRQVLEKQKLEITGEGDLMTTEGMPHTEDEKKTAWYEHSSYHFQDNQKLDSCIHCRQLLIKSPEAHEGEPDLMATESLLGKEDERETAWDLHRSYHFEGNQKPESCIYCWELLEKQETPEACKKEPGLMATESLPEKEEERKNARYLHSIGHLEDNKKPESCIYCRQQIEKPSPVQGREDETQLTVTETLPDKDKEPKTAWYIHSSYHFKGNEKPETCMYYKYLLKEETPSEALVDESILEATGSGPIKGDERKMAWNLHCSYHLGGIYNEKPDYCIYCREVPEKQKMLKDLEGEPEWKATETVPDKEDETKTAWNLHNSYHLEGSWKPECCFYCRLLNEKQQEMLGCRKEESELSASESLSVEEVELKTVWYRHSSYHSDGNRMPDSCIYCRQLLKIHQSPNTGEEEPCLTTTERLADKEDERKVAWSLHESYHFGAHQKPECCVYCKELRETQDAPEMFERGPELIALVTLPDKADELVAAWYLHNSHHMERSTKPESCIYCRRLTKSSSEIPAGESGVAALETLAKEDEEKLPIIQTSSASVLQPEKDDWKIAWYLHISYHFEGNQKPDSCIFCWQQVGKRKTSRTSEELPEIVTKEMPSQTDDEIKMGWYLHRFLHLDDKWKTDNCIYCCQLVTKHQTPDDSSEESDSSTTKSLSSRSIFRSESYRKFGRCLICWTPKKKSKSSRMRVKDSVSESKETLPEKNDYKMEIDWHIHRFLHVDDNWETERCIYCRHFNVKKQTSDDNRNELEGVTSKNLPTKEEEEQKALHLHNSVHGQDNQTPDRCTFCRQLVQKNKSSEATIEEPELVMTYPLIQEDDEMKIAWHFHSYCHVDDKWKSEFCIYCRQKLYKEQRAINVSPDKLSVREVEMEDAWHLHNSLHVGDNLKPDSCTYCRGNFKQYKATDLLEEKEVILPTEMLNENETISNLDRFIPVESSQGLVRCDNCKQLVKGRLPFDYRDKQSEPKDEETISISARGADMKQDGAWDQPMKAEDGSKYYTICYSCIQDVTEKAPRQSVAEIGSATGAFVPLKDPKKRVELLMQGIPEKEETLATDILPRDEQKESLPVKHNQYFVVCSNCMELAKKHQLPKSDKLTQEAGDLPDSSYDEGKTTTDSSGCYLPGDLERKPGRHNLSMSLHGSETKMTGVWSLQESLDLGYELQVACSNCKRIIPNRIPDQPISDESKAIILQVNKGELKKEDSAVSIHLLVHFQDKLAELVTGKEVKEVQTGASLAEIDSSKYEKVYVESQTMALPEPIIMKKSSQSKAVQTGESLVTIFSNKAAQTDLFDDESDYETKKVQTGSSLISLYSSSEAQTDSPFADDMEFLDEPAAFVEADSYKYGIPRQGAH